MRIGGMRQAACGVVLAMLAASAGCGGGSGAVEPLEGMEPMLMYEMATEAYSMWDPAAVQLVDMDLVRGRRVDPERYDLDIRYTVRKVNEPTFTPHTALAVRAAQSPQPGIAAQAPKLRELAQVPIGGTAEFTETIVLVQHRGMWIPQAWRDNERARAATGP